MLHPQHVDTAAETGTVTITEDRCAAVPYVYILFLFSLWTDGPDDVHTKPHQLKCGTDWFASTIAWSPSALIAEDCVWNTLSAGERWGSGSCCCHNAGPSP